jgi:hypothetical protein
VNEVQPFLPLYRFVNEVHQFVKGGATKDGVQAAKHPVVEHKGGMRRWVFGRACG